MAEFTYENQGTNTYLVYKVSEDVSLDTMSLGMLSNNKISGMAPVLVTQINQDKYLKYNVSAKISVKQLFSGPVNKKRLLGVCNGIVDALLASEEYMIEPQFLLTDFDYIFADVSTCETVMICIPVLGEKKEPVDFGLFFKNIMFSTQFDQTENCDYLAKIINYLNSAPVFSLTDFKAILKQIENGVSSNAQPQIMNRQAPAPRANGQRQSAVKRPLPPNNPAAQPGRPPVQPPVAPVKPPVAPVQPPVRPATPPTNVAPPAQRPPVAPVNVPGANVPGGQQSTEKMSMLYLLQHYNKENAAAYKAQKGAKKQPNGSVPPAPMQQGAKAPKKPGSVPPPAPAMSPGFAIPGQPTPSVSSAPPSPAIPKQPVPAAAVPTPSKPAEKPVASAPMSQPTAAYRPAAQPMGSAGNFGETTVLGAGMVSGETTVLNANANNNNALPHLIRQKNNERISINKDIFRIGKERSFVDYFIGDNAAISRSHANIITRNNEYFVVDTNSTNHTYVNGEMIQSNGEVKLNHGDKVRLANDEFEFRLY